MFSAGEFWNNPRMLPVVDGRERVGFASLAPSLQIVSDVSHKFLFYV